MFRSTGAAFSVLLLAGTLAGAGELHYLEQELVVEAQQGRPENRGLQKVWWDEQRIRSESTYDGRTSVAIIDDRAGKVTLLFPGEKTWLGIELEHYRQVLARRLTAAGLNDPQAEIKLEHTGRQRRIGDWDCHLDVITMTGKWPVRAELWVADQAQLEPAGYLQLLRRLGLERVFGRLAEQVEALGGLVIESRTEQEIHGQKIVTRQRIVKISSRPDRGKTFAVPAGWQQLQDEKFEPEKGGD